MKVAQLLYSGMGGHGSVAFSLLDADRNHEWHPAIGFLGIEPVLPAYAMYCNRHSIDFSYFAATVGRPWKTWGSIIQWLNSISPNAIILHSVTALLPCFWHASRHGVPLVLVEHQANQLKRPSEWLFSLLAMLLADRVVVLTPTYGQELKARLGLFYRSNKVCVIPNGIDTAKYTPSIRVVNNLAVVRMGMAARFITTKRQDVLVDMMTELHNLAPQVDWQLSLAGDGECLEYIEKKLQLSHFADCINLPGQLDELALTHWYQSLDIYLHASDGETLSTSLLQAMATCLPIVASDVPGIRNLLGDEPVCGLLVKNQCPKEFANSVIKLVNEKMLAESLALSGRQLVISSYSQNEMFSSYVKALIND